MASPLVVGLWGQQLERLSARTEVGVYVPGESHAVAALLACVLLVACGKEKSPDSAPKQVAQARETSAAPDGAALYQQRCVSCHQPNGQGVEGTFPPIAGSDIVNGPAAIPIRIVLKGLQGPIRVRGKEFNGLMPAYGVGVEMTDDEVSAVLTYERSSFGNSSNAVSAADVARERAAVASKTGAWTAKELGLD